MEQEIEKKLLEMGIALPSVPKPLASYISCVRVDNLLFVSGLLPLKEGKLLKIGRVGEEVTIIEAQQQARQIVINALAIIRDYLGSLNRIKRCIKINGYVACTDNFFEHPKILNAASELLVEIFGENGKHTRTTVGVLNLPFNSPIEIDFIFEVK